MHPMSWHQKRAHLSAMAQGRAMFGRVKDMTPARFDILYWIYRHRRTKSVTDVVGFRIAQATLTRALGLARQTVFKMVKRLKELGLVTVTKDLCDRRRNVVKLTDEGIKRIRLGMGAAFSEVPPLPKDAPCERDGPVPRYWRRPELADLVLTNKGYVLPDKVGREVGKIFTRFAWKRVPGGRRGKRERHLQLLDRMIRYAKEIARALGDTSFPIYTLGYEPDH